MGAVWGAALLVLLPNWTNDLASSFSLSTNVAHNLPLAIYGLVLIGAMLAWPSGIQGGFRAIGRWAGPTLAASFGRGRGKAPTPVAAGPPGGSPAATVPDSDPSGAAQPGSEAGAKTTVGGHLVLRALRRARGRPARLDRNPEQRGLRPRAAARSRPESPLVESFYRNAWRRCTSA